MKIKKNITVTLLSAFVTMAVLFGGYTIFAKWTNPIPGGCSGDITFEDIAVNILQSPGNLRNYSYACVRKSFQKTMDGLFQAKMKGVVVMFKDTKDPSDVITKDAKLGKDSVFANPFLPVGKEDYESADTQANKKSEEKDPLKRSVDVALKKREIILDKCQAKKNGYYTDLKIKKASEVQNKAGNLSTYCVAMEAAYFYEDYEKILFGKIDNIILNDVIDEINQERAASQNRPLTEAESRAEDFAVTETAANVEAAAGRFATKVTKELDESKEVLKATVGTYDEFKNAYPMHKIYRQIITDLVKYKTMLRDIRTNMVLLPAKFINLTSFSCP